MSDKKIEKTKRNLGRFRATFELYKNRSRDYRQQNLEFMKVLQFYQEQNDGGILARTVLESFQQRCNQLAEYELDYKNKFYSDPPDKDKKPQE